MKFVAALLIVGLIAGVLLWRRARRRQRLLYIERYPYRKHLDKRLAARRPELSAAQRQLVFDGLREYFHLCRAAGKHMVAMPSQAVDDAWHEFILSTRRYQRFCAKALGRFVHHTPAEAMRSATLAQEGIKRAWRLSCQREGIDPQAPRGLPLLFALDGMLCIGDGFRYELDCLAAGGVGAGRGSAFCASHIGCGADCGGSSGDGAGESSADGGDGGGCGGD